MLSTFRHDKLDCRIESGNYEFTGLTQRCSARQREPRRVPAGMPRPASFEARLRRAPQDEVLRAHVVMPGFMLLYAGHPRLP